MGVEGSIALGGELVESKPEGKVSVLLQDLAGGGAERVMLSLAVGLHRSGLDVELVLVRKEGPYVADIPGELKVICLDSKRTSGSFFALVRYLRARRPAALLSALVHVNVLAILACRLSGTGTRSVVTEHNMLSSNFSINTNRRVALAYRFLPWIYPRASKIISVSQGVADEVSRFSRLSRQRIEVIYNPVVTPDLLRRAQEPPQHPWFDGQDPPVILAVGRLTRQKDFPNLLRAFAELLRKRDARLVILGEGPERPVLEAMISELLLEGRVDLPGFLANPYALMSRARLFVLSSQWEGLPTVLVEALACDTSVVATDCPSGPREILADGEFGTLVPVGNSRALAAGILKALDNPMAPHLLQRCAQRFSAELAFSRYRKVLLNP